MGSKTRNVETERTQKPAVGIDATQAEMSHVARTVLRAESRGHPVIVGHDGMSEAVHLADYAGAVVLDVSDASEEPVQSTLARVAKAYGYQGLIWHGSTTDRIDYQRSVHRAETTDEYLVEATTNVARPGEVGTGVLVAIPAYNEAGTIGEVIKQARSVADSVVVVNDGSDDDTAVAAERAGASVVSHDRNRGYGAATKTAFRAAARRGADHLVLLDGDGQHDPSDVPKLVEAQREEGAEIVIGSRFAGEADSDIPLYRSLGLLVINVMTNVGLGTIRPKSWIHDTQSGFRAYNETAIRSIADDDSIADHMDASTDIIYHARNQGYTVAEVGTEIDYDVENGNNQNPVSHGLVLVTNLLHLIERERPITLIGVPGFVTAFAGFGFGYWTFTDSVATGTFPVEIAFAAVFLTLTGILACFSALILHSIEVHLSST